MDMASFYREILRAVSTNDLKKVISAAYAVLGYPIVVIDQGWFVLANEPHEMIGDPYWDAQQEYGYTPNHLIMSCYRNGYMDAVGSSGETVILDWGDVKCPHIGKAIIKNDSVVGYMSIYYTHDGISMEYILEAANILGSLIGIFFQKDSGVSNFNDYIKNLFVKSLFEGKSFSQQEIDDWTALTKISLHKDYVVLAINNSASDRNILACMDSRIGLYWSQRIMYCAKDICYMLVSGIRNKEYFCKIRQNASQLLLDAQISCGCSYLFSDLSRLPKYMFQARKALEYSYTVNSCKSMCSYDEVCDIVLLSYIATHMERENYMHPLLKTLKDYDGRYNTQYFDTLRIYLNNICNSYATAKALNIHRNTLLYRLNKISEICECDLKSRKLCRQLMLSMQVLDADEKLKEINRT
jgi:hypothetical protein